MTAVMTSANVEPIGFIPIFPAEMFTSKTFIASVDAMNGRSPNLWADCDEIKSEKKWNR